MEKRCPKCGAPLQEDDKFCAYCGAKTDNNLAATPPKTIWELQRWYQDRNLPPYEVTRFFIGQNYQGKRAFGIYEEKGEFIVYKNKDDGSRAIRYKGPDEAHAVSELYEKLKSEIETRKNAKAAAKEGPKGGSAPRSGKKTGGSSNDGCLASGLWLLGLIMSVILGSLALYRRFVLAGVVILLPPFIYGFVKKRFLQGYALWQERVRRIVPKLYLPYLVIALLGVCIYAAKMETPHYYYYDDTSYVWYDDHYYYYNNDDYYPIAYTSLPEGLRDDMDSYVIEEGFYGWDDSYSFTDSNYYQEHLESDWGSSSSSSSYTYDSDYDWDSGSSWDSGGWDSGDSDWGSDW